MIESPYQTSAGHIEIDGLSLRVLGTIQGRSEVGAADERSSLLDIPAVYADFSGGMGATDRHIDGMYGWGEFIDTFSCPGVVLPAGEMVTVTGPVNMAFGTFASWVSGQNQDLYVADGRGLYKVANGSDTIMQLFKDLGPGVSTENAVDFNGKTYIGSYATSTGVVSALYQWDPTTSAVSSASGVNFRHLGTALWAPTGVPRWVLIGSLDHYRIQYCFGDPMVSANWFPVGGIAIGSSTYHIRSIITTPRHAYFGKQEGVFDLDERGIAPNLTSHWRNSYDIENGAASQVLDEYLYSSHVFGIDRVALTGERQDIPEPCHPGEGLPFSGPIWGRCTAMTTWRGWLVAAIYNHVLKKSYVCFGKDRRHAGIDGPGPMVWHGAYAVVAGRMTHMRITSPTTGPAYLYMFYIDDTTTAHYAARQDLPRAANSYQDLVWGGPQRFHRESSMVLADGWPEHPSGRRAIWRHDIEAQRMTGVPTVRLLANKDGAVDASDNTVWEEHGWSSKNGRSSFLAPSDVGSAARIRFKLEFDNTPTEPPVFLSLRVRADINFELPDMRTYTVDLRADQDTGIGTVEVRQAYGRLQHLKRLVSERSVQVTMRDEFGMTWQVSLLQIDWDEQSLDMDEYGIQARITVRMLYRNIRYDDGDNYDEGHPYG